MGGASPWDDHDVTAHVINHVAAWWPGRGLREWRWELGDFPEEWPDFRVLCAEPVEPREPWVYVSAGAWEAGRPGETAHEFVIRSPIEERLHVENLAAIVRRQADPEVAQLRRGSLLPLGEPWLEGSVCDHFLFASPPPEWPEHLHVEALVVHFLLVIFVTAAEASHAREHGAAALEELLGQSEADVLDARRTPVVGPPV